MGMPFFMFFCFPDMAWFRDVDLRPDRRSLASSSASARTPWTTVDHRVF